LQVEPITLEIGRAEFDREATPEVANNRSFDPPDLIKVDDNPFADFALDHAEDCDASSRNVDRPTIILAPVREHISAAKRHSHAPVTAVLGWFQRSERPGSHFHLPRR
jgi:hypothetical protein